MRKTQAEVLADLDEFLVFFEKRLIHAVPWRFALDYVDEDFSYEASSARLGRAIGATLGLPGVVISDYSEARPNLA